MKKMFFTISLLLFLYEAGFAETILRNYAELTTQVQKDLEAEIQAGTLRISIPGFITSQKKFQEKNEIGEYFSDKLSVVLFKSKKIKIYERSKLNNILKEHELLMSGVIDEDEVVKLGELAPIDAILFGSYLKMKSSLEITLRLVSVTSGEITWTYSEKIALSDELNSLFSDNPEVKKMTDEERIQLIKGKLKNITSQDDIDQLNHLLAQIPVFSKEGDIHKTVIEEFHKMKVYDAVYAAFLISELKNIDKILNEDTASKCTYILHYVKDVDGLSTEEYELGMKIMKMWNNRSSHSTFIKFFFETPPTEKTPDQRKKDIDAFLRMYDQGKLSPLEYDDIFLDLSYLYFSRNVNSIIHDDNLVLYVFDRMYEKVSFKNKPQMLSKVQNFYVFVQDDALKERAFDYLCKTVNQQDINKSLGYSIYTIAKNLEKAAAGKTKNTEYNGKHLKPFIKNCEKTILKVMAQVDPDGSNARDEWKALYERNGLTIP